MKKIQTLIAVLAVIAAPLIVATSVSAASVSLKIISTNTTANEVSGTPPLSKAVKVQAKFSAAPDAATTVKIFVSGQCQVGLYEGGAFTSKGSSVSKTISGRSTDYVDAFVWGVDDSKYEGNHSCRADVIGESSDLEYNEISSWVNVPIKDNDPAPAAPKPDKPTDPMAPDVPKLTTVTVDGTEVDTEADIEFEEGKPLGLKGETIPNGEVTIYIYSDPKTANVTADENGDWEYTVKDLEAGEHHIETEVTDPETDRTSEKETVLAFTVLEPGTPSEAANTDDNADSGGGFPWLPVIGIVVLLAAAGAGFWFWKKKKGQKKTPATPVTSASPVAPTAPQSTEQQPAAGLPTDNENNRPRPDDIK